MVFRQPEGVMERYFPSRFLMLMFPSLVVIQPRSYTRRMTSPIAVSMFASEVDALYDIVSAFLVLRLNAAGLCVESKELMAGKNARIL